MTLEIDVLILVHQSWLVIWVFIAGILQDNEKKFMAVDGVMKIPNEKRYVCMYMYSLVCNLGRRIP